MVVDSKPITREGTEKGWDNRRTYIAENQREDVSKAK